MSNFTTLNGTVVLTEVTVIILVLVRPSYVTGRVTELVRGRLSEYKIPVGSAFIILYTYLLDNSLIEG